MNVVPNQKHRPGETAKVYFEPKRTKGPDDTDRIETGEKYAEEQGFVYEMRYTLRREQAKWLVTGAEAISGQATNTVIPWPKLDRRGNVVHDGAAPKPSPK